MSGNINVNTLNALNPRLYELIMAYQTQSVTTDFPTYIANLKTQLLTEYNNFVTYGYTQNGDLYEYIYERTINNPGADITEYQNTNLYDTYRTAYQDFLN